jgi:hypothetical protein
VKTEEVLLTPQELAARLQVTPGWVYRHAGRLRAFHLGKYLRFSWPRVLEAMERFESGEEPNDHNETAN